MAIPGQTTLLLAAIVVLIPCCKPNKQVGCGKVEQVLTQAASSLRGPDGVISGRVSGNKPADYVKLAAEMEHRAQQALATSARLTALDLEDPQLSQLVFELHQEMTAFQPVLLKAATAFRLADPAKTNAMMRQLKAAQVSANIVDQRLSDYCGFERR